MELETIKLIKVMIAGILFSWIIITKNEETKKTLFWVLSGYLLLLGVSS